MKSADDLIDDLKIAIDELRLRLRVSDRAMTAMNELYQIIWTEVNYDPTNDSTQRFASRLLPYIKALNQEFSFKK